MVDINARKKTTFFRSGWYILIIMLATLGAWVTKIPYIAVGVYCAAMLLMVLIDQEMTGLIPIVLNAPFIFADPSLANTREMTVILVILIAVFMICSLIYYEKHKLVMHFNRGLVAFLLLGLALLLGGLLDGHLLSKGWRLGLQIILGLSILYLFLCNFIRTNWKLSFAYSLVGASLVVAAEFWLSLILGGGNFFDNLVAGGFHLGWGDAGAVAMALLVLAPFSLYLAMRARRPLFYSIIYFVNIATVIASGESLAFLVMLIFTLIMFSFGLRRARRPKKIILEVSVLSVVFLAALVAFPLVRPVAKTIFNPGLGELLIQWEIGITEFINGKKLFGMGFLFNSFPEGGAFSAFWYQSSILQVLNNLGIVGLLLFVAFTIFKYKLLASNFTIFSKFSTFALMMAGTYAAVSTNYFQAYHLLPMVVLLFIAYNDIVLKPRGEYGAERYRLRIDNYRFVYGKSSRYKERIKIANPNYKYYKVRMATKGKFLDDY